MYVFCFIISEHGSQDIERAGCTAACKIFSRMKSILLLSLFLMNSLALQEVEKEGPTICTPPSGTCYLGSQLDSDAGNKFYSFQGLRSVLLARSASDL